MVIDCGMYCTLLFFFFNDTATTEIYTLSLHDALPISARAGGSARSAWPAGASPRSPRTSPTPARAPCGDRKSTRLNSSHMSISYAVFCLKKKKKKKKSNKTKKKKKKKKKGGEKKTRK